MVSFLHLPEHLVGEIYSRIDGAASRQAFFSSSRVVHLTPSVLAQITTLRVQCEQLHNLNDINNPLASFPSGARMNKVIFCGSRPQGHMAEELQLLRLLQPDAPIIRQKIARTLESVQELVLQDVNYISAPPFLFPLFFPNLKVLRMGDRGFAGNIFADAPFLKALSSLGLKELHLNDRRVNDTQGLGSLTSLTALSFNLPHNRTSVSLAPLTSLSSLRHLSICEAEYMPVDGLAALFPYLREIRVLSLPELPFSNQLGVLPPTIERLNLHHVMALPEFAELLRLIAVRHFPALRHVSICELALQFDSLPLADMHALETALAHNCSMDNMATVAVKCSVVQVDNVPASLRYLSALGEILKDVQTLQLGDEAVADDMPRLAALFPHLANLSFWCSDLQHFHNVILFRELKVLNLQILTTLTSLPNLGPQLLTICVAAALSTDATCPLAIFVEVASNFVEEGLDVQNALNVVQESWETIRDRLMQFHGQRAVSLSIEFTYNQ